MNFISRLFRDRKTHSCPSHGRWPEPPEPKTLFTGDDSFTKGGPLEGIPTNPKSEHGKHLLRRGYIWDGKRWFPPMS